MPNETQKKLLKIRRASVNCGTTSSKGEPASLGNSLFLPSPCRPSEGGKSPLRAPGAFVPPVVFRVCVCVFYIFFN